MSDQLGQHVSLVLYHLYKVQKADCLAYSIAFNIVISLNLVAFLATYIISIGCVLHRRITAPHTLPSAKYSLGRWGIPVNIFACAYSCFAFVFSCFPVELPVDPASANYAPAIFVAVLIIAVVSYICHGKTKYYGPVVYVEGRRAAGVGFQSAN